MAHEPAKAMGGGVLGGLCGALAGVVIGAAVGQMSMTSGQSPPSGVKPMDDIAGLFDACFGFIGALVGAAIGGTLGGVGGSVLGAGLWVGASRRASSRHPGFGRVETPEEEQARLRQRLAELEWGEGDVRRHDPPRDG